MVSIRNSNNYYLPWCSSMEISYCIYCCINLLLVSFFHWCFYYLNSLILLIIIIRFRWIWLQPSFLLPSCFLLLGFHYLILYLCLIESWKYLAYPFSTLFKFVLKWNEDDDEDQLEQLRKNKSFGSESQRHKLSIGSASSLISVIDQNSNPNPQFGYKTRVRAGLKKRVYFLFHFFLQMISRLLPQAIKEVLSSACAVCAVCVDAVEKVCFFIITCYNMLFIFWCRQIHGIFVIHNRWL